MLYNFRGGQVSWMLFSPQHSQSYSLNMTWRNALFSASASHQTATGLSITSTDWGRSLSDIYVKAKLNHNSHMPATGNRLLFLGVGGVFLNIGTRCISIKVNCKYHSTIPATLILHLFNQLVF